jgi:uncharacterized protein YlxW (UPF0749 family)
MYESPDHKSYSEYGYRGIEELRQLQKEINMLKNRIKILEEQINAKETNSRKSSV